VRASTLEASTGSISTLADIMFLGSCFCPQSDVLEVDIVARGSIRADDSNWTPCYTVRAGSLPIAEGNVVIKNAVAGSQGL
jgi:hypothetical protein